MATVKFIQAAFKKDMVKVLENGKDVWYNCDKAAKGFASKAFKEGDEVELVIEQRGNDPFVTQVRRPGGHVPAQQPYNGASQAAPSTAPQAAPAQAAAPYQAKPAYGQKSPEESEKITRLSVMSSATQAVQVMTGQINDPNVLGDVVVSLYNRMLAEIKK